MGEKIVKSMVENFVIKYGWKKMGEKSMGENSVKKYGWKRWVKTL